MVALFCPHAPPIERITIVSDMQWAFGYVRYDDPAHKYIQTRNFFLDLICVAFGGREAERLLLDDVSTGAGPRGASRNPNSLSPPPRGATRRGGPVFGLSSAAAPAGGR